MVHLANSWLSCAMRSASWVEIPGRCIWPSLLERQPSPYLVRRTQPGTVPIAWATALPALLPSTSFFAVLMRRPPINAAAKLLHPFWKLMSTQFSTPFAGRLRFADERCREFFCALACTFRLSARDSGSLFFPAPTSLHVAGCPDWC